MACQRTKMKVTHQCRHQIQKKVTQQETVESQYTSQCLEIDFRHGRFSHSDSPPPMNQPPTFVIPANSADLVRSLPTMKTEWTDLPFAIPSTVENHTKINDVLRYSLQQQKELEISDNAAFIIIILRRCLDALGIDCKIAYGFRVIEDEKVPHIWMVVQGYVIDNTYLKELSEQSTNYLRKNTPVCYEEGPYVYPETEKLFPKPKTPVDTVKMTNTLMKKRIEFYLEREDQTLALFLNREQGYNFYFSMIRHMFDRYQVSIKGLDPKIRYQCWCCDKYAEGGVNFYNDVVEPSEDDLVKSSSSTSWKLLRCDKCMVAGYCSPKCQQIDWFYIHTLFCVSRGPQTLPMLSDIPFLSDPVN